MLLFILYFFPINLFSQKLLIFFMRLHSFYFYFILLSIFLVFLFFLFLRILFFLINPFIWNLLVVGIFFWGNLFWPLFGLFNILPYFNNSFLLLSFISGLMLIRLYMRLAHGSMHNRLGSFHSIGVFLWLFGLNGDDNPKALTENEYFEKHNNKDQK